MNTLLANKLILITGESQGVGADTARAAAILFINCSALRVSQRLGISLCPYRHYMR